jgi:hypothetical protein
MTAEQLTAKLSDAMRREIGFGRFPASIKEYRSNPTRAALCRRGLCEFTHAIGGRGDWTLTPLGHEVRAIVQKRGA